MTDTMESNLPVGAGVDQPQVSQPEGVQQSSPGGVSLESVSKQIESLTAQMRGLQSITDKTKAETNREFKSVREQVEKVKAYLDKYPDPEQAARWMALDAMLESQGHQAPAPELPVNRPPVSGQAPVTTGIDAELLALLGVDPSDPQFVAEMARGNSAQAAAVAVAKSNRQVGAPNPAGIQPTGAVAPATTQKAALEAAYQKELSQIPRGGWAQIALLNEKYRAKGLEKW